MPLLAIKCYLPGRKTQYVLSPTEDMSIDLGMGADLCPRGFDAGVRVRFLLVGDKWYVEPQSGQIHREDGRLIEGSFAASLPLLLFAGSATLVLDGAVDPRLPARLVQGSAHAGAPPRFATPPVPRRPKADAVVSLRSPEVQPRAAMRQPEVAPALQAAGSDRRVRQNANVDRTKIELNETRLLDMAQLGVPSPHEAGATDAPEQTGIRTVLARLQGNRRMMAYTVLGLLLVSFEFGIRLRAHSTAARAALIRQGATQVAGASTRPPRPGERHATEAVAALPAGTEPNADRAAELYALGDYRNALLHYRALSSAPDADPVFGVIARALDQKLRHSQAKR